VLLRNSEVGGGGKFEATAQRVAIQGRDERLPEPRQRVEGTVAVAHPGEGKIRRVQRGPGFDVATGTEGLLAFTGDDGGANLSVCLDQQCRTLKRQDHVIVEGVELFRPRDADDGE
jgi:hypothetical protein